VPENRCPRCEPGARLELGAESAQGSGPHGVRTEVRGGVLARGPGQGGGAGSEVRGGGGPGRTGGPQGAARLGSARGIKAPRWNGASDTYRGGRIRYPKLGGCSGYLMLDVRWGSGEVVGQLG